MNRKTRDNESQPPEVAMWSKLVLSSSSLMPRGDKIEAAKTGGKNKTPTLSKGGK